MVIILTAVAWWWGLRLVSTLENQTELSYDTIATTVAEALTAWLCVGMLLIAISKLLGIRSADDIEPGAAAWVGFILLALALVLARPMIGKIVFGTLMYGDLQVMRHANQLASPAVAIDMAIVAIVLLWSVVVFCLSFRETTRAKSDKLFMPITIGLVFLQISVFMMIGRILSVIANRTF